MQARRADVRSAGERLPTRFEAGESADRRIVRYDLARITDQPDEVGVNEVGLLGRGDEVLVLDRQGMYRRIRTPDGLEGWVHRTILGSSRPADPVPDGGPPSVDPREPLLEELFKRPGAGEAL